MKICRKHFTLFELLISVALLMIIVVVLLRMLALTRDYWHYSNTQSNVYVDHKVLFDMLEDEFSNMVYNYDNAAEEEKFHAPLYIGSLTNNTDSLNIDGTSLNKGAILCFVTHTRRDSTAEYSDICKVAYVYYPPVEADSNAYNHIGKNGGNDYAPRRNNGVIVRAVLNEDSSTNKFTGNQNMNNYFAFDYANAKEVISGVVDFKIQAYKYDSSGNKLVAADASDGNAGVKDVRAITVTVTMLPEGHLAEFRNEFQEKTDCKIHEQKDYCNQQDFLHKHSRTFSRTYWITPTGNQTGE